MSKEQKDLRLYQGVSIKQVTLSDTDPSIAFIEGYASVYRESTGELQIDRDGETVNTDNLDLSDYMLNPVLCYNHQWGSVVGKVISLEKDFRGLHIKAEVHKITGLEHAFEGVVKGLIRSFSIGFIPMEHKWYDDDTLEISRASLIEISLAPVQSNPKALFSLIGTKSLGVSVKELKEQNNLTCDDVSCMLKSLKGKNMNIEQKDATIVTPAEPQATPSADVKPEPVEPQATPVVEPQATPVAEPKLDLATLVQSITEANLKADEIKANAEKARVEAEEKVKADAEQKKKQDAENVLNFLKDQAEVIKNTNADDLDVDSYEEIYELATNLAEALEGKVQEVLSKTQE